MQPPVFWARIAVDVPNQWELQTSPITQLPMMIHGEDSARSWAAYCLKYVEMVPSPEALDFDPQWHEFIQSFECCGVFVNLLKQTKNSDGWTMRQGPQRRLQAWLKVVRVEDEDCFHVYYAADLQNDFEFITKAVSSAIHRSFLRIHGVRDHECSPLVFHNQTFYNYFGPESSIRVVPSQSSVASQ